MSAGEPDPSKQRKLAIINKTWDHKQGINRAYTSALNACTHKQLEMQLKVFRETILSMVSR